MSYASQGRESPSLLLAVLIVLSVLLLSCSRSQPTAQKRPPASPPQPAAHRLELAPGTAAEATLAGGVTESYLFPLKAGQFAGLVVDQQGIDVAVALFGPEGRELRRVDTPNGTQGPEPMPIVADTTGSYRLEIAGAAGDPPGRYALRVEALRTATDRDRRRTAAEDLLAAAEDLRRRDDRPSLEAAADRQLAALRLFQALGDRGREAETLSLLGWTHRSLDRYPAAVDFYRKALSLFRSRGDERRIGATLKNLGQLQQILGDPAAALASYEEALAINRRLGERWAEVATLNSLGQTREARGESAAALAHYEQALTLSRSLRSRENEAAALLNIASVEQLVGQPERALDPARRALAILASLDRPRDTARALFVIGNSRARSGHARKALAPLRRARLIQHRLGDRRGEGLTLNDLGWSYIVIGDLPRARNCFDQALALFQETGDRPFAAAALAHLGWVDGELGRPQAAAEAFGRALPVLAEVGDRTTAATALLGLARARRRLGDLPGALQAVETGIAQIESVRTAADRAARLSFFASKQPFYELAIDLLMDLHRRAPAAGYDGRALAVSEEARARDLLERLASQRQPQPLSLREIQSRVVDRDTLLLEYALGKERSFLWVVGPQSLASFELPPRPVIEDAVRRAAALLTTGDRTLARDETDRTLAELSRLLLAPAAGRLQGKRLLIAGDGALYGLPFAALPVPGSAEPLIEGHEIVDLPSASSLAVLRREHAGRKPSPDLLAVLADPVFDTRFARLPGAADEAAALLALAPPASRLSALGLAASRDTVLSGALSRYRIVHFATHGVLDAVHPEQSGLVLSGIDAQGRPRDGLLRTPEIYRLHLPAELVVLSACRTALGPEIRGEGLVGLPHGFLTAGARSVLVSLWEVEDRATAELMRRFYRGMLHEQLPPAAALRAAQTALRREPGWDSPYFWAGFVLQGDWQPFRRQP
jgi:CHAT domain-containing protein